MERLNWHLAFELGRYSAVHVVAPEGAKASAPDNITVSEVPLVPLSRFLWQALLAARREAAKKRPAVVLAGSGLTAPLALMAARQCHALSATYVHGLDLTVSHPVYRGLWLPALRGMDKVIANSHSTAALAETQGVRRDRISIIHPGVELPNETEEQRQNLRQDFLNRHKLHGRRVLITVGRLTLRKGVSAFVREVLPRIVKVDPRICLLVIGEVPKAALAARADPPEAILSAANVAGIGNHVRFLGSLKCLKAAWYAADVHVFPVRHDPHDPEGFGMVAVEAAAHGVPTVAYATGGVTDAVADGVSGRLVQPGDAAGFAAATLDLLSHPLSHEGFRRFAEKFAWQTFGECVAQVLLQSGG